MPLLILQVPLGLLFVLRLRRRRRRPRSADTLARETFNASSSIYCLIQVCLCYFPIILWFDPSSFSLPTYLLFEFEFLFFDLLGDQFLKKNRFEKEEGGRQ